MLGRAFWIIVVIISIVLTIILFWMIVTDYIDEKIISNYVFEKGNWKDVDFPAVTICNKNQVRRSFLLEHNIVKDKEKYKFDDDLGKLIDYVYKGTDDDNGLESYIRNFTTQKGIALAASFNRCTLSSKITNFTQLKVYLPFRNAFYLITSILNF